MAARETIKLPITKTKESAPKDRKRKEQVSAPSCQNQFHWATILRVRTHERNETIPLLRIYKTPIISKRWLETLAPKILSAHTTRRLAFTMPA